LTSNKHNYIIRYYFFLSPIYPPFPPTKVGKGGEIGDRGKGLNNYYLNLLNNITKNISSIFCPRSPPTINEKGGYGEKGDYPFS